MGLKIGYITDERFPSVHTDTQQMIKTADALGGATLVPAGGPASRAMFEVDDGRARVVQDVVGGVGAGRAADAERADARAPRGAGGRLPVDELVGDVERGR